MKTFDISYIIATRNRHPYLKILFEHLLPTRLPNEEIVVVDGDSSDGSKEFLQELFESGKIDQFISEPDKNQAHGWNKAMLCANGTIIKKIIDDDVFCYQAIRQCKDYMLQNPDVDVIISNDLSSSLNDHTTIHKHSRLPQFEKWRRELTASFTFGDVHMLVRKRALAYIGLYNPGFVMMDWEYSLRISYLKASVIYYTGYNALSVAHPQTISALKNGRLIKEQGMRANVFYEYGGDEAEISSWSKIKIGIGKRLYAAKKNLPDATAETTADIGQAYDHYYNYITELNSSIKPAFLHGK